MVPWSGAMHDIAILPQPSLTCQQCSMKRAGATAENLPSAQISTRFAEMLK
jgi:hypothetical protein